MSLLRSGYYGLSWVGAPLVSAYLKRRAAKGHEDRVRLSERIGFASALRPEKLLLWIHAVSVGEAVAALTIVQAILKNYPDIHALITTTTVSSAKVITNKLPRNVTHQYCPVDTPQAVRRFLDHWQPDLAIWIESELWPNLIHGTQERGIPTLLLNGRMSPQSFSYWVKVRGMVSSFLSRLQLCAVQSEEQACFFQALGADPVVVMGNVKLMMTPLSIEQKKYQHLEKLIGSRPFWLAASTHPGEEEIALRVHKRLQKDYPDLLTILVPRHTERALSLQQLASKEGLASALRTEASSLDGVDVYIGNTLGEMGIFYALSSVALIGATFVPKGGHNPVEAAQLGAFVLHGPYIESNKQLYNILDSLGLSVEVQEESQLTSLVEIWLRKQKKNYEEPQLLKRYREEGIQNLMGLLTPHLKALREDIK